MVNEAVNFVLPSTVEKPQVPWAAFVAAAGALILGVGLWMRPPAQQRGRSMAVVALEEQINTSAAQLRADRKKAAQMRQLLAVLKGDIETGSTKNVQNYTLLANAYLHKLQQIEILNGECKETIATLRQLQ